MKPQPHKMIAVTVRFYSHKISPVKGAVVPREAWDLGEISIEPNAPHGIPAGDPVQFLSVSEISGKIENVLIDAGVSLHPGRGTACLYTIEEGR